jgi:5-deoxy-D-glucuronate isomerase
MREAVTKVPKVTSCKRSDQVRARLSPLSRGADQAVGDETKEEIHNCAQVQAEGVMPRRRGHGRNKGEVHDIAQNDRQQSLKEVD